MHSLQLWHSLPTKDAFRTQRRAADMASDSSTICSCIVFGEIAGKSAIIDQGQLQPVALVILVRVRIGLL